VVAEAKEYSPTERICKFFLNTELNSPIVDYGFKSSDPLPQASVRHIAGTDEAALIQHSIWATDKETTLTLVLQFMALYETAATYQTPYGALCGAAPTTYTWLPDGDQPRYTLDVVVATTST
jgi:hypothetical protein